MCERESATIFDLIAVEEESKVHHARTVKMVCAHVDPDCAVFSAFLATTTL